MCSTSKHHKTKYVSWIEVSVAAEITQEREVRILSIPVGNFMIFPEWVMVNLTIYKCKKDGQAFF